MIGTALACGWVDIKNLHPYPSKIWGDLSINLSAFISLSARLSKRDGRKEIVVQSTYFVFNLVNHTRQAEHY